MAITEIPLSAIAWAVHMVAYHGACLFFELCDQKGYLSRFKVRSIDKMTYLKMLPRVLFNQTFILLPCMLLVEYLGWAYVGSSSMSFFTFILCALAMTVGHDVVQYITHRGLLHNRRCRWMGHHMHHSTIAARALSACYMSSIDFFLEIVLPFLVPLVLIGGGGSCVWFHLLIPSAGAIGGLYEHSGYDFGNIRVFPFSLISSHAHGQHHTRANVSYSDGFGSSGICDRVLGTAWNATDEPVLHDASANRSAAEK